MVLYKGVFGSALTLYGSIEVAKLSAGDPGINHIPEVITDCAPGLVRAHLHTTFVGSQPVH